MKPSSDSDRWFWCVAFILVIVFAAIGLRNSFRNSDRIARDAEVIRQNQEKSRGPYDAGYEACKAGVPMGKNPYNYLHNTAHAEWQRGYIKCQQDEKDAIAGDK